MTAPGARELIKNSKPFILEQNTIFSHAVYIVKSQGFLLERPEFKWAYFNRERKCFDQMTD